MGDCGKPHLVILAWKSVCQELSVTLPSDVPHKIPVVDTDDTKQTVTISPLSVIAELESFHAIIFQQTVTSSHVSGKELSQA